ncbi:MAG TPA: cellulose binding domain-containing protein [Cellvibrio sp.]|nr:cellulose binding domain-containing protein [Cellvibrio sp.]
MKTFSLKKIITQTIGVAGLCVLALPSMAIWTIKDGKILDPNGQPFVFRGVTIDHIAAPDKAVQAIKDAAAAGANAVQVEISTNVYNNINHPITVEQLRTVIQACKDNKVVCVLEPNDAAGYPTVFGSASPDATMGFWSYPAFPALIGQQDYVILGMGNQALGDIRPGEYTARMQTYVGNFIRAYPGFLVMIDGSNWGQDATNEMQAFAAQSMKTGGFYAANLIYSVEMFDAYTDPEQVRNYIASFAQIGAPLVIGGFAPTPYYHPHNNTPITTVALQLPAVSVMEYAQQYSTGYFAWNWSGSSNPGLNLVTDWDANKLTPWGELAINGLNGLRATAKLATHFDNSSSISSSSVSSSSSSAPNKPPVAALSADVFYLECPIIGVGNGQSTTDPDGDYVTYKWEVTNDFNDSLYHAAGTTVRFNMDAFRIYTVKLIADDGRGGISTATKTLSHSYSECVSSSSSVKPSSSSRNTMSSSSKSSSVGSSYGRPSSVSSKSASSRSVSSASRSSSSIAGKANCSYVINSQWNNGFTAAIRIKNNTTQIINGWSVDWQYTDGSKITGSWNATLTGANPYNAKNLSWNTSIQPGQTVEFGFQGSKSAAAASVPVVTGSMCQ